MIENIVADYLRAGLEVTTRLETPEGPPERYVLVEKLGSGEENGLCRARIAVQSLAPTLYEAAALNALVKRRMRTLPDLPRIFRCECDTDYNHTDPRSRKYRYQAIFTIHYKED